METAGVVLGAVTAVGLLGQIFDGCVKAYSFFTSANNLGKESEKLVCKIRIEEMRLMVWGREWGVVEGKLEAYIGAQERMGVGVPLGAKGDADSGRAGVVNDGLRQLAETILKQLLDTITDFRKLEGKYGLKKEGTEGTVANGKDGEKEGSGEGNILATPKGSSKPSLTRPPSGNGKRSVREEFRLRAHWVISDKEKFGNLLADLKDYNDGLERLFPPARIASLERTWINELLQTAKRDVNQLSMLETASKGIYPHLNTTANLKQLRINLDAAAFVPTAALKVPLTAINFDNEKDKDKKDDKRLMGMYRKSPVDETSPVVVEYIAYEKDMELDSRLHLYQRVDNLARMVRSASNRHPDLHTLDCVGYLDDTPACRYGLVYRLPPQCPSAEPTTLTCLIEDNQLRTPDLGHRFQLSLTLATALWSFHTLDWLHKTFCSSNILFFNPVSHPGSLEKPYVTGFDSSRPDSLSEMTVASTNIPAIDLYRHPDSLGVYRQSYRKSFDVYSLGLVLLEIGLWKSLKVFDRRRYSPSVFRDKVVMAVLVPGLASKTGGRYRDVVMRCLTFEGGSDEAGGLMEWVVATLEGLRV